jgi:hypothetical protein
MTALRKCMVPDDVRARAVSSPRGADLWVGLNRERLVCKGEEAVDLELEGYSQTGVCGAAVPMVACLAFGGVNAPPAVGASV